MPTDADCIAFIPADLRILQSTGEDSLRIALSDKVNAIASLDNEPESDGLIGMSPLEHPAKSGNGKVATFRRENIQHTDFVYEKKAQPTVDDAEAGITSAAGRAGVAHREDDRKIKRWIVETADPFESGLAAFCDEDYLMAATQLQLSLELRTNRLAAAQEAATKRMGQLADAAFFLGAVLFEQGKYQESADAYERCLQIRTQDTVVLNNEALSLAAAGDYAGATLLYRKVLEIFESKLGPGDSKLAIALENLGRLLEVNGDYEAAEPLYRRALSIEERVLQSDHPRISISLKNLAALLVNKGAFAEAKVLFRKAFEIDEVGCHSD